MLSSLFYFLMTMVFALSVKNKAYYYSWIPVLLIVYELASDPDEYILFNLTDAKLIGFAEKTILILISGLLWYYAAKKEKGKKRWMPVLFSTIACGLRFVRSVAFDWYTGQLTESGEDVTEIYQAFASCCSIIDIVMKLAILLMLVFILLNLSRAKAKTD